MFDKKEYLKQWRKDNPEYMKKYRKENKERILKSKREYRKNNKISISKYQKEWWENNPEYRKIWKEKNKKHILNYSKKYSQKNKEKINKVYRKWIKTEKGKASAQRKYIARQTRYKEIINTLTAEEWIDILKQYKFRCAYCGKEFTLFDRPTRDHIIPISKGGDNVKENIVPACGNCNSKKFNKILT